MWWATGGGTWPPPLLLVQCKSAQVVVGERARQLLKQQLFALRHSSFGPSVAERLSAGSGETRARPRTTPSRANERTGIRITSGRRLLLFLLFGPARNSTLATSPPRRLPTALRSLFCLSRLAPPLLCAPTQLECRERTNTGRQLHIQMENKRASSCALRVCPQKAAENTAH